MKPINYLINRNENLQLKMKSIHLLVIKIVIYQTQLHPCETTLHKHDCAILVFVM